MVSKNIRHGGKRKIIIICVAAIAVVAVAGASYLYYDRTREPSQTVKATAANKHSDTNTKGSSEDKDNPKAPTVSTSANQGTAKDANGQSNTPIATTPAQWATSESQIITLKLPVAQMTFKPGDSLAGSAVGLREVQYRLIDNKVGVIAQGYLSVVDGNFAGTMQFKAHDTTGRLDVFSTNDSGAEINEVQVPINF